MVKDYAVVVLANGFEEIEALSPIDILRRAGLNVIVAGVCANGSSDLVVKGAHGVPVVCDCEVSSILKSGGALPCAVILPGGMPGATNLYGSEALRELVLAVHSAGGYVCAICASPAVVLAPLGVLDGKRAVCYPGMEVRDENIGFEKDVAVVKDDNVITGAGPGCAMDFSFEIVRALCGSGTVETLKNSMVCGR